MKMENLVKGMVAPKPRKGCRTAIVGRGYEVSYE